MIKRITALFLAALLLFASACTANVEEEPAPAPAPAQVSTPNAPAESAPADEPAEESLGESPGDEPAAPVTTEAEPVSAATGFQLDESKIRGRTITLYHQSEGADTRNTMAEFSEMYGCEVELLVTPYDQYASRLISLIMSGDSPDIIDINDETMPIYALRKIVEPIDGFYDPESPYIDRSVMDAFMFKGKNYLLHPNGRPPVMIFFNKTMFDRYGVDTPLDYYERGEWTIDTLYEVAREFNEDTTGDGVLDQFGFVGTSVYEFLGANQLPLAEYDPITSKFRLALGDTKQQEVLQDALDHIVNGDIQPFAWTAATLFPQGNLAMAGYEEWFHTSLGSMEDEWGLAPYPTGKYGDPNVKYVRPWGSGVASGADNGYAGIQYQLFSYQKAEEAALVAPWTGERAAARDAIINKDSYFSMHIGIPNFRPVVDAVNYGMAESGGKPFSALFEERRTELEGIIEDFNGIEEGWVEPKQFTNPGPVDFENGMGYLAFAPDAALVTQEIIDGGIEGKSLKITMTESGWHPIFGSTAESLSYVGGSKAYRVTFDYEIVAATEADPMFYTLTNPGEIGWTEQHVLAGESGTFDMVMNIIEDMEDMYFTICFFGGTEVLIDNFNIELAE